MSTIATASKSDAFADLPMGQRRFDEDPVFETAAPSAVAAPVKAAISEDFGAQLHDAQERLLELRHQAEKVEKQRSELEELRGKQERFLKGRVDIVERLTKGLTRLDRDTFQARKRLEMLDHAKVNFGKHLDTIESLNPEHWSRADLRNELVRATAALEDAEQEYAEAMARLGMTTQSANSDEDGTLISSGPKSFALPNFQYWLLSGLAFTLPLVLVAIVYMILQALQAN